jgi:uncharacterized surface protein with fasciclin (FAS1) repeats
MNLLRKVLGGAVAAAALTATVAVPSGAQNTEPNVVDVVISVSGASGFDSDGNDYDLLREALIATDLADAVATTDDITVFAPRDSAFVWLARDLGYSGTDEAGAFGAIAAATGYVSAAEPGLLDDVLLYHVAPGAKSFAQLQGVPTTTLQGSTLTVHGFGIIDNDLNNRNPRFRNPKNLTTSNGIIHTVNKVLRPIDLDPTIAANVVDVVLAVSGSEGFDDNGNDYDLLREALVAADLVDAVATAEDITVFAPRDSAFVQLARQLGYTGTDEAGAFGAIAAATGYVSAADPGLLDDVLLYHVAPGSKRVAQLQNGPVATLGGGELTVNGIAVVDADPNAKDARMRQPRNLPTGNGIIHTINKVLRPIDL